MILRPYQEECVSKVAAGWREFERQLLVVPTGGGKTVLFAHMAAEEARRGGKTLILCHREELVRQAVDKIKAATGLDASVEKADEKADRSAAVVVASVQTMQGARLESWPEGHFKRVVCDEAHHSISESWQSVLWRFRNAQQLGVTATPDRGDKRNLGVYWQAVAHEVFLTDLIHAGYLSPISIKSVPLRIDLTTVKQTAGDFDSGALGGALEPYLASIAQSIRDHAGFRKVLAFLPLIETSKHFAQRCREVGLSAAHVDGYSEDRAEILERFAGGEFDVLSNAMLLTEGYDCPDVDCVVVLRPTRSRPLHAQMIGRGTRIAPHKTDLLVLDFLWLHERHSITRPAHLIASTEEEAEAITKLSEERAEGGSGAVDLEDAVSEVREQREGKLHDELKKLGKRSGKHISAEEFALNHHALAVCEYEEAFAWERSKVSDKQMWVIKRAGIDPATVRSKGHASQLIGIIKQGEKVQAASPKQKAFMKRMGMPNWEHATVSEARRAFAEARGR